MFQPNFDFAARPDASYSITLQYRYDANTSDFINLLTNRPVNRQSLTDLFHAAIAFGAYVIMSFNTPHAGFTALVGHIEKVPYVDGEGIRFVTPHEHVLLIDGDGNFTPEIGYARTMLIAFDDSSVAEIYGIYYEPVSTVPTDKFKTMILGTALSNQAVRDDNDFTALVLAAENSATVQLRYMSSDEEYLGPLSMHTNPITDYTHFVISDQHKGQKVLVFDDNVAIDALDDLIVTVYTDAALHSDVPASDIDYTYATPKTVQQVLYNKIS